MAVGRQLLILPRPRDAHRFAASCGEEAGRGECLCVIGALYGLGGGSSETYPAIPLFHLSNYYRDYSAPKSLQIAAFLPTEGSCGTLPPAVTPAMPPGDGAKHRCDPHRRGGAGTAGDREEGENRRSRQAYSGRPARMVYGPVPGTSNGPASLQLGGAGLLQRSNEFSACQSREQRDTGPRTPLHASEGRPRARYDKKEHNKCSQVEYDSC
jgi:hypothetical protein